MKPSPLEEQVQLYIIRQGDFLAYKYGFDADKVWNDPTNDALKQVRPDPNILWPMDVLYLLRS